MIAQVKGNLLQIRQQHSLTQGSVGQRLSVALSEEWAALTVTAVFSAGTLTRDVVVSSEEIVIPWELLTEGEHKLFLNFHGALSDGSIVMRTNIASLGLILPSRAPSGNSPQSPSPTRADQIQALAEQALALAQSVRQDAEDGLFGQNGGTVTVDDALSGTSTNPVQNKVVKAALDGKGTYSKPSGGIPKSDLASGVQTSLGKADTALQSVPSTYRTAAAQDTIDAGKIDKPSSPASGAFLVYEGSAWVAQTLAAWQASSY